MEGNDEKPLPPSHADDEKSGQEKTLVGNNEEVSTLATAESVSGGLADESVKDGLVEGTVENAVVGESGPLGDREQEDQQVTYGSFLSNFGAAAIGDSEFPLGSEANNVPAQTSSTSTIAFRLLLSFHSFIQGLEALDAQRLQTISQQKDVIAELEDKLQQCNQKANDAPSSSSQAVKNLESKGVSPPMQDVVAAGSRTYGEGESVENSGTENDADNSDQERAYAEEGCNDDDTDIDVEAISEDSPDKEDHAPAP